MIHCTKSILAHSSDKVKVKQRLMAILERYGVLPVILTVALINFQSATSKTTLRSLIETHSWSTVKLDRCGLQFFYKHVLGKKWLWVDIVKPPIVRTLPDILTPEELSLIINATREARYQTYILVTYSMGLRLGKALNPKLEILMLNGHGYIFVKGKA